MRGAFVIAAFALLTALAIGTQTALVTRAGFFMGDFHAFYCAARVASTGGDPYRTEPLRSCEKQSGLQAFFQKNPGVAVPAPLPGYSIGAFVPLAILPGPAAAAIWLALLLVACALSVLATARFAAMAWPVPTAAFALSLGAASIPFGEIVPIAIAAICASAYFAWRGRWVAAAIAAAVAMVEPHLGLPVCLALAVWAPGARLTLALSAAVLAAISLVAIGPAANLEYFSSVLPAHALSEAARDTQLSLTSVLASLGINDLAAVRAGSLWYLAMLVIGALVAGSLAKRTQNSAFLVCVPPAFAVFGGTFVHVTQIVAALPLALLLARSAADRRHLVVIAAMFLSVPWSMAWSPALGLAPAVPIGSLAWWYWNGSLRAVLIAAVISAGLLIGLNEALALSVTHAPRTYIGSTIDRSLAEAPWSRFTARSSNGSVGSWLVRLPTWAGLMLLLGITLSAANVARMPSAPHRVLS